MSTPQEQYFSLLTRQVESAENLNSIIKNELIPSIQSISDKLHFLGQGDGEDLPVNTHAIIEVAKNLIVLDSKNKKPLSLAFLSSQIMGLLFNISDELKKLRLIGESTYGQLDITTQEKVDPFKQTKKPKIEK